MRHGLLFALTLLALASPSGAQQTAARSPDVAEGAPDAAGTWRAVVVGVSDYDDLSSLQFADDDAQAFHDYLIDPAGGGLAPEHVELFLDGEATRPAIGRQLITFASDMAPSDRLLFYFAGHGDVQRVGDEGGDAYILLSDAEAGLYDFSDGALDPRELEEKARQRMPADAEFVFVLDACRSGAVAGAEDGARDALRRFGEWQGVSKLLASTGDQLAWEDARWGGGHGVFTYFLLQALYGLADGDGDARVSFREVSRFVIDSVEVATERTPFRLQTPVPFAANPRAPLFAVAEGVSPEGVAMRMASVETLAANDRSGAGPARIATSDSSLARLLETFQRAIDEDRLLDATVQESSASAWALHRRLLDVLDASDPEEAALGRRVQGSLAVALQEQAARPMRRFVRGVSDVPSSADFAAAADALSRALGLLGPDYPYADEIDARRAFAASFAIVRARNAGRYAEAEALLDQAEAASPGAAQIHAARADLARARRDYPGALRHAERAVALAPRWEYAHVRRADVLEDLGRYGQALDAYDRLVEMYPQSRYAVNNRGILYLALDRYAEARRDFGAAQELHGDGGIYLANLAAVDLAEGRLTDAQRRLTDALAQFPDDAVVHWQLGRLHRALDQGTLAAAHLSRSAELQPQARTLEALGELYRSSDRERAQAFFRDALRLDPAHVDAYAELAALLGRDDHAAGEAILLDADAALPALAQTANSLGWFYHHRDRPSDAERWYRAALDRNPDFVWPFFNLAVLLDGQGRADEAAALYESATRRFDGNPIPFTRLGAFRYRTGAMDAAAEAYRCALAVSGSYVPALAALAEVEAERDRFAEAAALFAQAAAQNAAQYPLDALAQRMEGHARRLERDGDPAAAQAWQAALTLAPDRDRPLRRLAALHYTASQPAEALVLVDRALAQLDVGQNSQRAQAHTLRALSLIDLGRPGDALADLDAADALRVQPDRRTRAIALWAVGRRDAARALHAQAAAQPAPIPYSDAALDLEQQITP